MEGVSSFGRSLRLDLQREGILVTEAPKPPHRAGRIAKNDFIDARRAATSVMGWDVTSLQIPRSGGVREALRILVQARHGLTVENTAQINRLTALVRTNALGIDARRALGRIQIKAIAKWRVWCVKVFGQFGYATWVTCVVCCSHACAGVWYPSAEWGRIRL